MSNKADEDSPRRTNWVQFEEEDNPDSGSPSKANEPQRDAKALSPSSNSSGVSSARGSVNSIEQASLAVSEVQNVDEQTLRKKSAGNRTSNQKQQEHKLSNVSLGASDTSTATVTDTQPRNAVRGRQFENGEVIVTLLPLNERFPWVTPARFRPELVPEELMAPCLTLTVEDYVQTMEKLVTDMRFTVYNIFYKRILIIWIITAFTVLLALLFSGFQGVNLFICGVVWLICNASAIFLCMWIKLKLNKQLERCMSSINSGLLKHNLILGVDDRGKLSCHKVNLCFMYFDGQECIKKLEAILAEKPDENAQNGEIFDREAYLRNEEGFEDVEVVVSGRNAVRVDRKAERAEKLYLHYIQRWAKDYLRRRLDWLVEDLYGRAEYGSNANPRHLRTALCPCQYIEEHLRNKRHQESLNPCTISANPCHWCD